MRGSRRIPSTIASAYGSKLASAIADNRWIYYLDIGEHFLDERGYVREDVTIDTVHPSPTGYRIWAEAMEPTIVKLMGE